MSLRLDEFAAAGSLVVAPAGRIDTVTAAALEERLTERMDEGHGAILLDLSRVDYVSSQGLRVVLKTSKRMAAAGRGFAVCGLAETVAGVFRVTGFDRVIAIHATRDDGLRHL